MKYFLALLAAVLLAVPVSGVAEQSQGTAAQTTNGTTTGTATGTTTGTESAKGAAAAAAAASGKSSPTVNPERYVIGADDSLQVTVWKEPTLSGTIPVRPDGMISLVLVGDLPAAGRTPMQLAADVEERLKKYIQDPVVTVVVLAVNSQKVFLIGEVGHVGPIMLTPGMTPLQAIAAAGGLSTFANAKHIYVLRGIPGKQQKIPFNYKKALKGDNSQDISLQPGDTIVVP